MAHSDSLFERIISTTLTVATVVAVGLLIEARLSNSAPVPQARAEFFADWQERMAGALVPLGDTARPVKVAVFTDFQCPFCANLDTTLTRVERQHPGQVARFVVHFPGLGHAHARDAAMAFECANAQRRGIEMHTVLYRQQARIGETSWYQLGLDAGVEDTTTFGACLKDRPFASRITAGEALGRELGIRGTPVVVINGWLFDPSFPEAVERAIQYVLEGRSPKGANRRQRS